MKVLIAVPLLLLALLGAAGMSSFPVGNDPCNAFPFGEGSSAGAELRYAPPGLRCVYTDGDGLRTIKRDESGSWPWFFVALAGELAIGVWYLLGRRSRAARWAFASTVALAFTGALGWYAGWQPGFFLGLVFSMPIGWLATRDPAAGFAAAVAVFVAGFFSLLIADVAACFVAVALAATAGAMPIARLRPAR